LRSEISYQKAIIAKTENKNSNDPSLYAEEINKKIGVMTAATKTKTLASEMLKLVIEKKGTVRIEGLGYKEGGKSVVIKGTAQDRASLIAFSKALESSGEFSAIDLPVSTLLPEKDITFSITATSKQK
jgi:hypothetical protein